MNFLGSFALGHKILCPAPQTEFSLCCLSFSFSGLNSQLRLGPEDSCAISALLLDRLL